LNYGPRSRNIFKIRKRKSSVLSFRIRNGPSSKKISNTTDEFVSPFELILRLTPHECTVKCRNGLALEQQKFKNTVSDTKCPGAARFGRSASRFPDGFAVFRRNYEYALRSLVGAHKRTASTTIIINVIRTVRVHVFVRNRVD